MLTLLGAPSNSTNRGYQSWEEWKWGSLYQKSPYGKSLTLDGDEHDEQHISDNVSHLMPWFGWVGYDVKFTCVIVHGPLMETSLVFYFLVIP